MSTATKLMEMGEIKGYEKGFEKGYEIGVKKCIEKGIEKGKEEAMIETCIKLLLSGADLKFVVKITSFPLERVKEIQAGMGKE